MKTMKRYLLRMLPAMVAAAMFMVSCSSASDEGAFIPKNATDVMHIDLASLWKKGDLSNADNLQMVKSLRQHLQSSDNGSDKLLEAILKDPSSCGIDFRQPVCSFHEPAAEDFPGIDYCAVIAKMQNRSKFEQFLANLEEVLGNKVERKDTLGLTTIDLGETELLAYNDDKIFFIENYPELLMNMDEFDGKVLSSIQYVDKLMKLKKEESMASNKYFDKYLAERKDFSYFMCYGNQLLTSANPMFNLLLQFYNEKSLEQFKEASMCIYGSFENGRLEITSKSYGIPEELQKFGTQKFNDGLLAYLPAQTLAAATFSVDMEAMAKFLDAMKDEDLSLDEPLGIKEYTLRDLMNALGGSLAASFYGMQEGTPYFAAAVDIKDNKVARDLLNELAVNNGNVYTFDFFPAMQLVLNDKVAVLSTDPSVIANAQAGGKSNGLMTIADDAKKGNYLYMDLNLENWPIELLDLIGLNNNPIVEAIFSMLDRIEAKNIDEQNGKACIFFTNDKVNSLAFILQEVDKMM